MNPMPALETALLDLLSATRGADLKLIVGGGYGIYLKREYVRRTGVRTLLNGLPEPRSTNDLDLFLRPELIVNSERLKPLSDALVNQGYGAVQGAEKFQFARPGPTGEREGGVKVDLLTGPKSLFADKGLKMDDRRVRPRPSVGLHAHTVDEAVTLEEGLLPITVEGYTSAGETHRAQIFVPHPLTFAMMKLFAFRDRVDDPAKDRGGYHALDLYSVLATATETEWDQALEWRGARNTEPMIVEAARIVDQSFASLTSIGMLRLRESPYARPELDLEGFISALSELFPVP